MQYLDLAQGPWLGQCRRKYLYIQTYGVGDGAAFRSSDGAAHARRTSERHGRPGAALDADWLRMLCLEAGADDVGFVPVDHPDLAAHRSDVLTLFPAGKALISIVCRMNREISARRCARSPISNFTTRPTR